MRAESKAEGNWTKVGVVTALSCFILGLRNRRKLRNFRENHEDIQFGKSDIGISMI